MAAKAKNDDEAPVLSEVEARGGVTGHHVRHVLAFGLAGSVVAFVMIALYFYYAKLISTISQLPGRVDLAKVAYFAIPLALGAVAIVLVLGLWNMVARPRPEVSQTLCAGGWRCNSLHFASSWPPFICRRDPRRFSPTASSPANRLPPLWALVRALENV